VHFAPIMLPCTNVLACILINGIDLYLIEPRGSLVRCEVFCFIIFYLTLFIFQTRWCSRAIHSHSHTISVEKFKKFLFRHGVDAINPFTHECILLATITVLTQIAEVMFADRRIHKMLSVCVWLFLSYFESARYILTNARAIYLQT